MLQFILLLPLLLSASFRSIGPSSFWHPVIIDRQTANLMQIVLRNLDINIDTWCFCGSGRKKWKCSSDDPHLICISTNWDHVFLTAATTPVVIDRSNSKLRNEIINCTTDKPMHYSAVLVHLHISIDERQKLCSPITYHHFTVRSNKMIKRMADHNMQWNRRCRSFILMILSRLTPEEGFRSWSIEIATR